MVQTVRGDGSAGEQDDGGDSQAAQPDPRAFRHPVSVGRGHLARSDAAAVSYPGTTVTDMTASMDRSYDIARRANMFRIYRAAGVMKGFLDAAVVYDNAFTAEVEAAVAALKRLGPYALERSTGDLHRAGTPEAQELMDAVMKSVEDWDAEMRRDPDDEDE